MNVFHSSLSLFIPILFPKYASKIFVKNCLEKYGIHNIQHISIEKYNNKPFFKAYIFINWIKNPITTEIQNNLFHNKKQLKIWFNINIKNGYWIIKKNNNSTKLISTSKPKNIIIDNPINDHDHDHSNVPPSTPIHFQQSNNETKLHNIEKIINEYIETNPQKENEENEENDDDFVIL